MYLAGISMFCTVGVLYVHHGQCRLKPVPRVLRLVVYDVIGRMICMNLNNRVQQSPSDPFANPDASVVDATTTSRHRDNVKDDENANANATSDPVWSGGTDHQQCIRNEWIETARIIDRFFFIVFIVIILVMAAGMLIVIVINGPRKVEPITVNHDSDSDYYE